MVGLAELTRLNQGYSEGSLELAQYDAAQALGAKASPEQIALAKERAKSIWEVQAATKAATKAEEDRKNSQSNFTSLQESVSPVTAIDNQFAKQMEQINQYKQLYPQSIAEAEALRSQIEEQYRQKRMDAQWQELSNASLGYNMLTSAVDSFGGNASNVITGLVTSTMSAADAARSLGNTMLNSVVNSLVQVGVEMLKNFIIGQTMGTAAAGASAAQATLVATAWAPAAALSSLATLGANAVAANSAIVGTVGVAKGMAVAGARYNGGTVGAGKMYQVGEHGNTSFMRWCLDNVNYNTTMEDRGASWNTRKPMILVSSTGSSNNALVIKNSSIDTTSTDAYFCEFNAARLGLDNVSLGGITNERFAFVGSNLESIALSDVLIRYGEAQLDVRQALKDFPVTVKLYGGMTDAGLPTRKNATLYSSSTTRLPLNTIRAENVSHAIEFRRFIVGNGVYDGWVASPDNGVFYYIGKLSID